jgi:signal peptide peptidase SppA
VSFKLISAIAKGRFLINPAFAQDHVPFVQSILNGTRTLEQQEKHAIDEIVDPLAFDDDLDYDDDDGLLAPAETENVDKIAVVTITGAIMHYGGMCSYGSEDFAKRIAALDADTSIGAIVIKIDSPGGQVDGTQTLVNAIKACTKPTVSFVNDGMAASAAYWIACAADEMYCGLATDKVGSIGVLCTLMDYRKFLEDNGIKQLIIYAPQSSEKNKDYQDALDGDTKAIEAELEFICNEFINGVTANRAGKIKNTAWNKGDCFFAAEAQKMGLIDGIKTFGWVVKRASALSQNTTANTSNKNMGLFGSDFPKLNALKDKDATAITAEELNGVNAELAEKGFNGNLVVISSTALTEANDNADAIANSFASIKVALGKDDKTLTLADATAALIASRDAEFNRAETYGKLPGAKPTKPVKAVEEGADAESEGGETLADKKPSFWTSVDDELAQMNKE